MTTFKLLKRKKNRRCAISGLEIPANKANCSERGSHGPRLCIVCSERISDAALRCNECGSYQTRWRRIFSVSSSTFAWLTALFAVIANLFTAASYYGDRQSHTTVKMTRADENYIYLKAWNTGRKPSVLTEFRLCFPPGVGLDSTALEPAAGDPDVQADSVIMPGEPVEIPLKLAEELCRSRKRGSTTRFMRDEVLAGLQARRAAPLMVTLAMKVEESGSTWDLVSHPRTEKKEDTFAEGQIGSFITARLPQQVDDTKLKCRWCIGGCPDLAAGLCTVDR